MYNPLFYLDFDDISLSGPLYGFFHWHYITILFMAIFLWIGFEIDLYHQFSLNNYAIAYTYLTFGIVNIKPVRYNLADNYKYKW